MNRHPFQRLLPEVPTTGAVPERDPEYGYMYQIIDHVALLIDELREEVWFDGILTDADGDVHLTLKDERVARVAMTSHHADARLNVLDPR